MGISDTPKGLQKQLGKTVEYTTGNWRMTANVNKCAVVVCNKDKVKPENSNGSGEKVNYLS